jgi:DNA sulfur modification protein DndD
MFKGESELNVFENATALTQLVNKYSDIRKFDELVTYCDTFSENAEKAYEKEASSDKKIAGRVADLTMRKGRVSSDIAAKKKEINDKESSIQTYDSKVGELEEHQETSNKYKDIKDRLKTQEDKRLKLKAKISLTDFNHNLLDKMWVLCAFTPILQEFKKKCSALSLEKRKQEKAYDKQKAGDMAKLAMIKEIQGALINGATELPWYLPNQETMEEMIHDKICKVCGRPAEEGSDAYNFMVHKLEEYKHHVEEKLRIKKETEELKEKELFQYNYIDELHNLSISLSGSNEEAVARIAPDIQEERDFIDRMTRTLYEVEQKIIDITDEKNRLLIQAGNVSEEVLEKDFKDLKGLYEQKSMAEGRLVSLKMELVDLETQYRDIQTQLEDLKSDNKTVNVYKDVARTLNEIAKAFKDAKENNLRNFLGELQNISNSYLDKLSANDFHGEVRLQQAAQKIEIHLYSSNGTEIKKPSGSQKTVMYISILFAISDFTKKHREEYYPLIFDAATSSFGDTKEEEFYNVINDFERQCIIVTKDFISNDEIRQDGVDKLKCTVYRIKKVPGFDPLNMATIQTIIKKVK